MAASVGPEVRGDDPRVVDDFVGSCRWRRPRRGRARSCGRRRTVSSGTSCSMTRRLAPSASRMRSSSGPSASASRWAMPLDGSSSRSTVGWWARTQARSTMRRLPVESSRTNLSRKAPRPMQLDELVDPVARRAASESMTAGRCSAAASGSRTSTLRSSATAIVSRDGERGEQAAVLERAAEPELGPRLRGSPVQCRARRRCVSPSTIVPASAGVNPEMTSKSVVLPAPFGPMNPTISPRRDRRTTRRRAR